MKQGSSKIRISKPKAVCCFALLLAAGTASLHSQEKSALVSGTKPPNAWSACASIAVKETFDENVYLQDVTSNAFHHSIVTSVLPAVGVSYKPVEAFNATLSYS